MRNSEEDSGVAMDDYADWVIRAGFRREMQGTQLLLSVWFGDFSR